VNKNIKTEEEIDAQFDKMKRLPRGSFKVRPEAKDPKNIKVKVTMFLDADILEYFKARAMRENAAPYQTQINNELRRVMESDKKTVVDQTAESLLNNESFIEELKKKLVA